MSLFRNPPAPPLDIRPSTIAAVRAYYITKIRALYEDPEHALMAEAETLMMSNHQMRAYYELLKIPTIHHRTAANLVERTPTIHLGECVRQNTEAEKARWGTLLATP